MSSIVLDNFGDAAPWSADAPDGSASSLVSLGTVVEILPDGFSAASRLQVEATRGGSAGHYAQRSLAAATDLSKFQLLRLWVNKATVTNGSTPFYVRLRLASAAAPFGSGGNTWSRLIPISVADTWQLVEFDLGDLPAAIRSAVTAIRLESATNARFKITFDSLLAVTPQMLPDIESALQAALDKRVSVGEGPVVAVVSQPGTALPAGASIRISPALVEYMPEISTSEDRKSDFTDTGFVMRPPLRGYCIYYDVDAQGPQAGDRSTMLDFVLGAIGAGRPLPVNGEYLPIEHVAIPWPTTPPPYWLPLRFRVKAWKPMAVPSEPVSPVRDVVVNAEEARA